MMKHWVLAGAVAACALAVLLAWPEVGGSSVAGVADEKGAQVARVVEHGNSTWPPPVPSPSQGRDLTRVPLLPIGPQMSAWQSMAESRHGDARTPPIVRDESRGELPSAAELADPKAYQQYEMRQNLRLYASFVQAARLEVPRLRADIERGRVMGIAPEKIAKVQEKVRRLEEMQERLLREHPQLH